MQAIEKYGAPGGTRTPDLLVRSQTLYPTELRAHPWLLFDSTALAILIRVPTRRRFLEHLEQVRQIRRPRSLLSEDGSKGLRIVEAERKVMVALFG